MNRSAPQEPMLFTLESTRSLAEQIRAEIELPLSKHEERDFDDGEHKIRPLVNVRGREAYVVASLYDEPGLSVNDKLLKLLFFLGALRDASAASVSAVVPYLCYARKDRKTKSRDPVTTRYVAQLFEAVQVDRVITLDVHNLAAFQNAFRQPTDHLEAMPLFVHHFSPLVREGELVVVSPDVGGVKRARIFRDKLAQVTGQEIPMAFMEKQRSAGIVSGEAFVGEVDGRVAIIIDDLIGSGTTLVRAALKCRERGAKRVVAAATHGVFTGNAEEVLSEPALDRIVVTNSIPPFRLSSGFVQQKLTILSIAPMIAEAIRRVHTGGSIVDLLAVGFEDWARDE